MKSHALALLNEYINTNHLALQTEGHSFESLFKQLKLEDKEDFILWIINNPYDNKLKKEFLEFAVDYNLIDALIIGSPKDSPVSNIGINSLDDNEYILRIIKKSLKLGLSNENEPLEERRKKTIKLKILTQLLNEASKDDIKKILEQLDGNERKELLYAIGLSSINSASHAFEGTSYTSVTYRCHKDTKNLTKNFVAAFIETLPLGSDLSELLPKDFLEKERMSAFLIGGLSLMNGGTFPKNKLTQLNSLLDITFNNKDNENDAIPLAKLFYNSFMKLEVTDEEHKKLIDNVEKINLAELELHVLTKRVSKEHGGEYFLDNLLTLNFETLGEFYKQSLKNIKDNNFKECRFLEFIGNLINALTNVFYNLIPNKNFKSAKENIVSFFSTNITDWHPLKNHSIDSEYLFNRNKIESNPQQKSYVELISKINSPEIKR